LTTPGLRNQAAYFNFADVNREIRDQLIKVLPWQDLSKEIYKEAIRGPITQDTVQELTRIHQRVLVEAAGKEGLDKVSEVTDQVNRLSFKNKVQRSTSKKEDISSANRKCYRCGSKGHYKYDKVCRAWNAKCTFCEGKGHWEEACFKRKQAENSQGKPKKKRYQEKEKSSKRFKKRRVNKIGESDSDSDSSDLPYGEEDDKTFIIASVGVNSKKTDYIEISVGIPVTMLVDSGSTANVIPNHVWKQLQQKTIYQELPPSLQQPLYSYSGSEPLNILTVFTASLSIEGGITVPSVEFSVVKERGPPVLTSINPTAKKLGVLVIQRPTVCAVQSTDAVNTQLHTKEKMKQMFPGVFDGLGKFNRYQIKITAKVWNPLSWERGDLPLASESPWKIVSSHY